MAVVSFLCSLFALVFLFLKLDGLPMGTKPPSGFPPSLSPTMFWIVATAMGLIPLFVASYVGAITAVTVKTCECCFSGFDIFTKQPPVFGKGNSELRYRVLSGTRGELYDRCCLSLFSMEATATKTTAT
jgi:hypothetical protein